MIREMNDQRVQSADLRQVCAEMERRLGAGENCTAESLLASHSQLGGDTDAALEIIYTEFVAREQLGQRPVPAEFCERFPHFRDGLEQLFQIHDAAGGASAVMSVRESAIPLVDNGCTQAVDETIRDRSLRRFGHYEILGELGRGGMGVVYKARQTGLNRMVALKMVLTGADAGPGERARFRAEAEAAARLQHPNIVQIHEIGEHEGRPFLALELIEGGSLDQLLNGLPLPAVSAARLVEIMARAIHHAHEKGVVHRDLKPANILLTELDSWRHPHGEVRTAGVVKITDFGLASRMPSASLDQTPRRELTAPNAIIGTPAYMAPEQAGVKGQSIGPAADVYALGAILYELLTGRPPFQGVDVLETLEQVRNSDPVPPGRLMPRLPRDIETICLKCLRKVPTQRYASAADLADDIGRYLRDEPILARPTPLWEKTWKRARRRPAVALLLGSLVLSMTIGSVTVTILWRQTAAALRWVKSERDEKERALASKVLALAHRAWLACDMEETGRQLDECPTQYRGPEWSYLHRVTHSCLRVINSPDGRSIPTRVVWSPDGHFVAGAYTHYMARVWDAETGREVFEVTEEPQHVATLAIDSNFNLTVIGWQVPPRSSDPNAPRHLETKTWDIATKRQLSSFGAEVLRSSHQTLSADGKRMAAAGLDQITVMDLPGGKRVATVPNPTKRRVEWVTLTPDGRWLAWINNITSVSTWDLANGTPGGPTISANATRVAFSRDGSKLAVAMNSRESIGLVQIIDRRSGKQLLQLSGHTRVVRCLAFNADGTRLVTGSLDKTIVVWDLLSGAEQFVFRGHEASIQDVAFSPDGQRVASAGDKTIRIWDVRPLE